MVIYIDLDIPNSPFRSYFEDIYFTDEDPLLLPDDIGSFGTFGLIVSITISSTVGTMLSGLTMISTPEVVENLHLEQASQLL